MGTEATAATILHNLSKIYIYSKLRKWSCNSPTTQNWVLVFDSFPSIGKNYSQLQD